MEGELQQTTGIDDTLMLMYFEAINNFVLAGAFRLLQKIG